jgi:hypothetical protein
MLNLYNLGRDFAYELSEFYEAAYGKQHGLEKLAAADLRELIKGFTDTIDQMKILEED